MSVGHHTTDDDFDNGETHWDSIKKAKEKKEKKLFRSGEQNFEWIEFKIADIKGVDLVGMFKKSNYLGLFLATH